MSQTDSRFAYLFHRYYNQIATQEEQDEFLHLLSKPENKDQLNALIYEAWRQGDETGMLFNEQQSEAILNKIVSVKTGKEKVFAIAPKRSRVLWASAAAIIIILLSGTYFWLNRVPKQQVAISAKPDAPQIKADIGPGGDKAVLLLANGDQIVLDSAANGTLTKQGNANIIKLDEGMLSYKAGNKGTQVLYNTIITPRGGEYQVVLSDGTKIWLNAASSLRFPTAFVNKERMVELTGEAYFEVAKNKQKPFIVKVDSMRVAVLGTHFNIMAYEGEGDIKTTLLEGSVEVSKGTEKNLLQPGQQARLNERGKIKVTDAVDVEEVVAWKNGFTSFKNADIKSIMRQIARWYNVDVMYEGNIPERIFTGGIARSANLSELLKVLQLSGIHFKLQGRTITVMP